jgi:hypothetical protein
VSSIDRAPNDTKISITNTVYYQATGKEWWNSPKKEEQGDVQITPKRDREMNDEVAPSKK